MSSMWRIFKYLKHFPMQIVLNVLFNLLHILFSVGAYVMIIPFVELMFGMTEVPAAEPELGLSQQQVVDWAFWHLYQYKALKGTAWCLAVAATAYLGCSLMSNFFRFLAQIFLAQMRTGLVERLRNDIYHKVTILPISYFSRHRRGDIMSRMSNDLAEMEWSVGVLQSLVKEPLNVIVFSAILIFVSWRLFILFLLVLPGGVWLIARIGKRLKHTSQRGQKELGRLTAIIEESLGGVKAIKSYVREAASQSRFEESNDEYARTVVKMARSRDLSSPLSEILGTLGLVIILILGSSQVFDGAIQPSMFIFFVIIFARLIPPIQAIVRTYNTLQKADASARRFLEVLDADEVIHEKPHAETLHGFSQGIEFRDVCFSYSPAASPVLSNINLTIPYGATVAIVGPSGAGKTTLVDLLPRFYDCTSGEILIDGHAITDLNINSLRAQFGLVSQNCILFNDTVANNIAFGAKDYNEEEIRRAAQVAHADAFISALPEGYNTAIGDRGLNLSGGERQRLSIARAVLRNTPILLLDEPTSALDSESEVAVQQGIDSLMQGRTSIIIAHRLSTIRHADLIVVMDGGRIVERGTHEQLMEQKGLYKKLVEMQTFAS